MNLKEKLARLDRNISPSIQQNGKTAQTSFSHLLPGEQIETNSGNIWRNRVTYDLSHQHGQVLLEDFFCNDFKHLGLITKELKLNKISPENLLFIDTETTGLSGGIGTMAFLVGIGYFSKNQFIIDQFFMRQFNEERALLQLFFQQLERILANNGSVVSFNGKSYDLPLLSNRAVFHRMRVNEDISHIDLVHSARRFWKAVIPDCSLLTLESEILKIKRNGDIPGYLIPQTYFRFLRCGDPRPLLPVFYHNQMDILTMVTLLDCMIKIFSNKTELNGTPVDWLAIGSAFEEANALQHGIEFYQELLLKNLPVTQQKQILLRLAKLHKKKYDYTTAIKLWQESLCLPGFLVEPYEELAKAFEHRLGDYQQAKIYTFQALENINLLSGLSNNHRFTEIKSELHWRLKRLERKIINSHDMNDKLERGKYG